jgi:CRISPR-associated endonuclease/helicase Cas3
MKAAQAFSVPIRIVKGFQNWERKKFYPIAPKEVIQYSEETGAEPCKE